MSAYITRQLTINEQGIRLGGVPFPVVSRMEMKWSKIRSVECVPCTVFQRAHAFGPDFLGQWWGFDPKRIFRKTALKITLQDGVFGFSTLMLTGLDMEGAAQVAHEYLSK